ncbi:prepilin peptidase [Chloroflexota bacterium]
MQIAYTVIFVLLGAAIGSFLNVCIDRLPAGKSLIYQSSHCDACQRRLTPLELIPVISYLALLGRCRRCRAHIPVRVLWVEMITAALFVLFFWITGLNLQLLISLFYCCIFVTIAFIDLEHKLILNKVTYPGLIIALFIAILAPLPTLSHAITGDIILLNGIVHISSLLNGLLGGITGFVVLLIPAIVFGGSMGWGDVKLAALIGLCVGFPQVLVAILMGIILGGFIAGLLLLLKIRKRKDAIPFGPFLALSSIATIIWGHGILGWYLSFF